MSDVAYKPGDLVRLKELLYVSHNHTYTLWSRTSCGYVSVRNGLIGMVISKHPAWEQYRVLVNDEIILVNTDYIVLCQKT